MLYRGVQPWIFNGVTGTFNRGFRLMPRIYPFDLATPMAVRLSPEQNLAEYQSLLHFGRQSPWDETALLRAVCAAMPPVTTVRRSIDACIVGDAGFPKKGHQCFGILRRYCGQLGDHHIRIIDRLSAARDHGTEMWQHMRDALQSCRGRKHPRSMRCGFPVPAT